MTKPWERPKWTVRRKQADGRWHVWVWAKSYQLALRWTIDRNEHLRIYHGRKLYRTVPRKA